jgi:dihydropteroate synthase
MLYELHVRDQTWKLGLRTYVMGILNVTPDSFSDGGEYADLGAAIAHARQMVEDGADIIDVGGESTRPGHTPVPAEVELERVIPVIRALRAELTAPISIDTRKATVARAAALAGADLINDVTGLFGDPDMAAVVAETGLPACLMHWEELIAGPNLLPAIARRLGESVQIALAAGVTRDRLIVDPGVGFGKGLAGDLQIIRELWRLQPLDLPILLGTSRKSVVGKVLGLPTAERVEGTAATVAIGIANGAHIIRVHDVKAMVRVARMTDAILDRQVSGSGPGQLLHPLAENLRGLHT